jgi:DNA-binding beta-propeller fold protein YncE/mono/diheme cytochrome c family protein
MRKKTLLSTFGIALAGLSLQYTTSHEVSAELVIGDFDRGQASEFAMLETAVSQPGGELISQATPNHLSSANIAAIEGGSLHVDADSGMLVKSSKTLSKVGELFIGRDASQLVVDRGAKRAFVVNRGGDAIDVVTYTKTLRKQRSIKTHAEPYGVALTPDAKTLLVTTVADQQLTAYDAESGSQRWSIDIGPEARGVAISPNGAEAIVTFLNTGAVARVPLSDINHAPRFVPLDRAVAGSTTSQQFFPQQASMGNLGNSDGMGLSAAPSLDPDVGRRFSRAAFSATYIGNDMAVIPHQESTPQLATTGSENTGVYGGGGRFEKPIQHRIAFVSTRNGEFERMAKAEVRLHQPRALTYDKHRDVLYVAGYGSDTLIALADASKPSIHLTSTARLSNAGDPCGPTGLAVADDGSVLAFCSLGRQVATLGFTKSGNPEQRKSSALTKSRFSEAAQRGRRLFREGDNARLSTQGIMACESCHPEVRADGLSWRISGTTLQTPLLAGKVAGTHPFKWDGGDKDLQTSLTHTVTRLGGSGINAKQAGDIAAFLTEQSAPRTPTVASSTAVKRGKHLFASKEVGCTSCHSGKLRTDRKSYEFADDIAKVDTPALVGLAASAPYYHDGSAPTLRSLLLENGSVHGMGKLAHLSDQNVDDLIAYLKTL